MASPSLAAADRTRGSDRVVVYEGDTVLLYCSDVNGYLYSDPPWYGIKQASKYRIHLDVTVDAGLNL